MQSTHLNGAQLFFLLHIFSFEILTFIEIKIDITTGGHQLQIRFLFFIVFTNGLFFKFSALDLTKKKKKKNLKCRMFIRNFADDVPYYVAYFTACSIFLWFICFNLTLRKLPRAQSAISVNVYYISVLCAYL